MMMVDQMLIRTPIARIEVDMTLYIGTVWGICMKDLMFDLIIGNGLGAGKWKRNDPNSELRVVAATVTKAQAWKPLATKGVGDDIKNACGQKEVG